MADYECHPVWDDDGGNVDPSSMAMSTALARALTAWGAEYTDTLNRADPLASGFADDAASRAWLERGADLATRLRGEGFVVEYLPDEDRTA